MAFCKTSVREPMAALLDELSGEFGPGRIAGPPLGRPVPGGKPPCKTPGGKPPCKTAVWSASCGRADGGLDVRHWRAFDGLQGIEFNPKPVARHDAGTVQADG